MVDASVVHARGLIDKAEAIIPMRMYAHGTSVHTAVILIPITRIVIVMVTATRTEAGAAIVTLMVTTGHTLIVMIHIRIHETERFAREVVGVFLLMQTQGSSADPQPQPSPPASSGVIAAAAVMMASQHQGR